MQVASLGHCLLPSNDRSSCGSADGTPGREGPENAFLFRLTKKDSIFPMSGSCWGSGDLRGSSSSMADHQSCPWPTEWVPRGRWQKSLETPDLLSVLPSFGDGSSLLCPPNAGACVRCGFLGTVPESSHRTPSSALNGILC